MNPQSQQALRVLHDLIVRATQRSLLDLGVVEMVPTYERAVA
jgi:hypothetical protein